MHATLTMRVERDSTDGHARGDNHERPKRGVQRDGVRHVRHHSSVRRSGGSASPCGEGDEHSHIRRCRNRLRRRRFGRVLMSVALGVDGSVERRSKATGYPMPPPLPGRTYVPVFNGNGQYRLPSPWSGKPISYTRASTVAKTLEDTWMLDAWAKRMMLLGLHQRAATFLRKLDGLVSDWHGDNPGVETGTR